MSKAIIEPVIDLFMQEEAEIIISCCLFCLQNPRKEVLSALVLMFLLLFISICLLIRSDTVRFNMKCNMQESLPEHSQIHLLSLSGPVGIFRLLSRAQLKSHLHIVAIAESFFHFSVG